jgi:RNA polymerase sigma factor for flagellar operon FliA
MSGMNETDNTALDRATLIAAELPPYPGIQLADITLVSNGELASAAQKALLAADAIGFDTESKPTFNKGEVSTGPHLVQLATDTHAWLFPTSLPAGVAVLKAALESASLQKIGFGLGNDRSALKSRLGIDLANVLDLGEILRNPGHRGTVGAKMAVAHFFGQRLQKSKKTGTSNWAASRLSERQILYAANDAHVAIKIYREWKNRAGKDVDQP